MVQRKFTDPAIDLTPAMCNLKITMSTLRSGWPRVPLKGG
jgi:hypothetical protein